MTSIDSITAQSLSRAYVQNTEASQARPEQASQNRQAQSQQADSVSLSDSAKSLASARDAVQNTPDVREQKVADIKQQISDGTYTVSSRVLARKMLASQQPPQ
jgi:negative regulator of flagellin synthesis FlgM